ncbi:MAG: M1 family metallopeptidase, partial [Candidatus Obscuribacterales bacterium]|nr:M1 family metallopeptidase [Candidatus Obscuribacterales bacterium]
MKRYSAASKSVALAGACIVSLCLCMSALAAEGIESGVEHAALFSGAESSGEIKYAPDRKVEIQNLAIDVTPNFEKRSIKGTATFKFKPLAKPLEELRLDAVELDVEDVKCSVALSGFQVTNNEIVISFAEPIAPGTETQLTIKYTAQPSKGLYFRVPSNGYRARDMHIWTQGETSEARHWFPCYDYPNLKFSSEVTCHVPEGMTVLSNGRMVSSEKDPKTGLLAVRWQQDKIHSSYLITLIAGYFNKLEDSLRDIPLTFYTPPGDFNEAPLTFVDTKPAMEFFEKEIAVPYPWSKYGQAVVSDYTFGGMENTSLTTLSEHGLHTAADENLHKSEGLVAHELAHQWFGDLVTCKDWSQVWLNEGFATFYAGLYEGHKNGRDEFLYGMNRSRQHICEASSKGDDKPVVYRRYNQPMEQFGVRAYQKGAWVLQMLRAQLGEDLYRRCIKTYLERHQFASVVTQDLNKVVEELSGRSFDRFFDQWIYHPGVPKLDVNYSWDEKTKLAKFSFSQGRKNDADSDESRQSHGAAAAAAAHTAKPLAENDFVFHFPVTVRFKVKGESIDKQFDVKEKEEAFYVPLAHAPELVLVDPELALLADIDFKPPPTLLDAQLNDKSNAMGRVAAVALLGEKKDEKSIVKLKNALQTDEFYGVRVRASESLKKIHSDEALTTLIDSTKQSDARVRNAVVGDIGHFFNPKARTALLSSLETEQNPAVVETALRGLSAYQDSAVREIYLKYLEKDSYRNAIAIAAIDAMQMQDDPLYIAPIREIISKKPDAFPSWGISAALRAVAYLARNEKQKDDVREFLLTYVNNKREAIQRAAVSALGSLEDPKAIAVLETYASASKDLPIRDDAEKAIAKIRAANKPNDNLKDLRSEVLELQKSNRDLKKDLEDLKKRL